MNTSFAVSPDGKRIAYDRCGSGPAILLVHGGGSNRGEWHAAAYVNRLKDDFTVITMDLRGHGESSLPTEPLDYTQDRMAQDILCVSDACGIGHFTLWAMSFGAKISRYLGARPERVDRLVLMSTQLGPGVSGKLRQDAVEFCGHWPPILQAQQAGRLNPNTLSRNDQDVLSRLNIPVMLGWVKAMLDWPSMEPTDFLCPTLWLIGSRDEQAMASFREFETKMKGSMLQTRILDGLDHEDVFDEIDRVLPIMLNFTRS
jgi:pimeloyl-ACP methyl ester carboxylesterase